MHVTRDIEDFAVFLSLRSAAFFSMFLSIFVRGSSSKKYNPRNLKTDSMGTWELKGKEELRN